MSERHFSAMGTDWFIRADGCSSSTLRRAQSRVEREEHRFSRFDRGSILTRLNRERVANDAVLASVVRSALSFRQRTRGAFDPSVDAQVIGAGYDRTFEDVDGTSATPVEADLRPDIEVRGSQVRLLGEGTLDLGGIVKGWTVDQIARTLENAGASAYVVDGGGDIRVGLPPDGQAAWSIGADEDHALSLLSRAVATSSTLRRRWHAPTGEAHHIISPRSGRPASGDFVTATVVAPDATTADVLGTALIVETETVLPLLPRFGAEALLQRRDGSWLMTPGLEGWLQP